MPVIFVDGVSEAFIVYSFGYNLLSPRLHASHIRWRNEYTVTAQPWVSIVELRAGLRGDPTSSSQWGLIEGGLRQGYFSNSTRLLLSRRLRQRVYPEHRAGHHCFQDDHIFFQALISLLVVHRVPDVMPQ